jgi:dipeptidase
MCDTLIATHSVTKNKVSIFAKNSDRPPYEAQYLVQIPAKTHPAGEYVQCTYIRIPQVETTHAVLLSQPFWMWGVEMGVNEHGLAIGNEAVFSKIPANKKPALLGMDLLRLALERAATPQQAIQVIVELLETFGQGGNCNHRGKLYYHNTFLLADAHEAWVLETIDKQWAARKVEHIYSISNILTLEEKWGQASEGLVEHAFENKLVRSGKRLNLTRDYSDFLITTFSKARNRCSITKGEMESQVGDITLASMMEILRNHNGKLFPGEGLAEVDVCMHAGFGPIRISQSTASMVVHLNEEGPIVFATGTSAPCAGAFKPFWVDANLPDMGPAPTDTFDPKTLFWSHERLHRLVIEKSAKRLGEYSAERDEMEAEFIHGALALADAPKTERVAYSEKCYQQAIKVQSEWLDKVKQVPEKKSLVRLIHNVAWKKFNREAKIKL